MRIGVFASGHVGEEVVRFLAAQDGALACLVLDAADASERQLQGAIHPRRCMFEA